MANYCNQREFIFIHIPRTAGGSMEHAINCSGGNEGGITLNNYKNGHTKLEWYPEHMVERFFKFSIVRNPWDRMFAVYKWKTKSKPKTRSKESFEEFLVTTEESSDEVGKWHMGFASQLDYLTYNNEMAMDHIIRFETLEEDFVDFQKRYPKIAVNKFPHTHNTRFTGSYRDYYTDKSLNIVEQLCQKDIEYFEYKF